MLFILAGTKKEADFFAKENRIDPKGWKYIVDADNILGCRGGYLIRVGTWIYKDKYYPMEKILSYCMTHDIKVINNLNEM